MESTLLQRDHKEGFYKDLRPTANLQPHQFCVECLTHNHTFAS
jgi:hypothetical protein